MPAWNLEQTKKPLLRCSATKAFSFVSLPNQDHEIILPLILDQAVFLGIH
jgi:hypothetical protein